MSIEDIKKIVIKKIFFYGIIIGIPITILAAIFDKPETSYISTIIIYSYIFFILFNICWSIKNKSARKKYIIYMGIVVLQIILLSVLGKIFGFKTYVSSETENSLLDNLSVLILFGTITGILLKIVHDCKKEHPLVKWLYFPISIMVFVSIFSLITALFLM